MLRASWKEKVKEVTLFPLIAVISFSIHPLASRIMIFCNLIFHQHLSHSSEIVPRTSFSINKCDHVRAFSLDSTRVTFHFDVLSCDEDQFQCVILLEMINCLLSDFFSSYRLGLSNARVSDVSSLASEAHACILKILCMLVGVLWMHQYRIICSRTPGLQIHSIMIESHVLQLASQEQGGGKWQSGQGRAGAVQQQGKLLARRVTGP